jgi:hypothetical protein
MTSRAPVLTFIAAVIQHFPPFRWDPEQEKAWAKTLEKELSGFPDAVLSRAIGEMIRTRKDRRIPLVSECIDYCLDARRWLEAEKGKGQLSAGPAPVNQAFLDWTEDAFKLSRKFKRLPPEGQIPSLKREAKGFDETYEKCVRGGFKDAAKWAAMGEEMLRRRNKLVDWRLALR